jgi:hypothetical protein
MTPQYFSLSLCKKLADKGCKSENRGGGEMIVPALMFPWMFGRHKEQKPIPHIPTIREMEGFTGYLKAVEEVNILQAELVDTFSDKQLEIYARYREKVQRSMMLKPDKIDPPINK